MARSVEGGHSGGKLSASSNPLHAPTVPSWSLILSSPPCPGRGAHSFSLSVLSCGTGRGRYSGGPHTWPWQGATALLGSPWILAQGRWAVVCDPWVCRSCTPATLSTITLGLYYSSNWMEDYVGNPLSSEFCRVKAWRASGWFLGLLCDLTCDLT